ncbi:MAG: hypothetical protein BWY99_02691 [Synergistetes bacterium ADurb.BinA166]|nr:MAG: hypothetical protein BWY99_02691 [Synergistetes bacterium ADurb.BinA166]
MRECAVEPFLLVLGHRPVGAVACFGRGVHLLAELRHQELDVPEIPVGLVELVPVVVRLVGHLGVEAGKAQVVENHRRLVGHVVFTRVFQDRFQHLHALGRLLRLDAEYAVEPGRHEPGRRVLRPVDDKTRVIQGGLEVALPLERERHREVRDVRPRLERQGVPEVLHRLVELHGLVARDAGAEQHLHVLLAHLDEPVEVAERLLEVLVPEQDERRVVERLGIARVRPQYVEIVLESLQCLVAAEIDLGELPLDLHLLDLVVELVDPEDILQVQDGLVDLVPVEQDVGQLPVDGEIVRVVVQDLFVLEYRLIDHVLLQEAVRAVERVQAGGKNIDVHKHEAQQYDQNYKGRYQHVITLCFGAGAARAPVPIPLRIGRWRATH